MNSHGIPKAERLTLNEQVVQAARLTGDLVLSSLAILGHMPVIETDYRRVRRHIKMLEQAANDGRERQPGN